MRTDELIHMLARQAGPAPRALAAQRLGVALGGGALLGLLAAMLLVGPIPLALFADSAPWIKLAYALALAAAATTWLTRLGRPGAPTRARARATAGVVLLMGAVGLASLAVTPQGERLQAIEKKYDELDENYKELSDDYDALIEKKGRPELHWWRANIALSQGDLDLARAQVQAFLDTAPKRSPVVDQAEGLKARLG